MICVSGEWMNTTTGSMKPMKRMMTTQRNQNKPASCALFVIELPSLGSDDDDATAQSANRRSHQLRQCLAFQMTQQAEVVEPEVYVTRRSIPAVSRS